MLKNRLINFMNLILYALAILCCFASNSHGLPIGFGYNQGDHEFSLWKNDDFYVYHNKKAKSEGRFVLESLTAAQPLMQSWMGISRKKPLVVISSANSINASFANFITDAIELQTLGDGDRDLVYHEYTHTAMYQHFDNLLGPAAAILYLPWMPAWWLEGLAESFSHSLGTDVIAAYERTYALDGNWPSYDRLHSFYSRGAYSRMGYAVSGAFVSYILNTVGPERLPAIMGRFYDSAQPWWWPWAAVPFNGFMPMEDALKPHIDVQGAELYNQYKKAATKYWKANRVGPFLHKELNNTHLLSIENGELKIKKGGKGKGYSIDMRFIKFVNGVPQRLIRSNNLYTYSKIDFSESEVSVPKNNNDFKMKFSFSGEFSQFHSTNEGQHFIVQRQEENFEAKHLFKIVLVSAKKSEPILQAKNLGFIEFISVYGDDIFFLEQHNDSTRLCNIKINLNNFRGSNRTPKCELEYKIPKRLRVIGENKQSSASPQDAIWLSEQTQSPAADNYRILRFEPSSRKTTILQLNDAAKPISIVEDSEGYWIIVAKRTHRALRRLSQNGACKEELEFEDLVSDIRIVKDGRFQFTHNHRNSESLMFFDKKDFKFKPCKLTNGHRSPLMYALQVNQPNMQKAFAATSLWKKDIYEAPLRSSFSEMEPQKFAELSNIKNKDSKAPSSSKSKVEINSAKNFEYEEVASWKGRPIFALPWLGGEDPMGLQVGLVSVPLMDHLQNETVRFTGLYGLESKFPALHLMLTSTRFKPTHNISLFRQQTYNGVGYVDGVGKTLYYDEKGVMGDVSYGFFIGDLPINWVFGYKFSYLEPYLGYLSVPYGNNFETSLDLSTSRSFWQRYFWSVQLSGVLVPEMDSTTFDYNRIRIDLGIGRSLDFLDSKFATGVEVARTRGRQTRILQEYYSPLKTFIPGSGGGYNQSSYSIAGPGALTSLSRGDSQGRVRANWTIPLLPDIDKQLWIFYIERLDLSNFYNYGAAWYGDKPRDFKDLISAYGHNFDLQLENKGIKFNMGLGVGKVHGYDYDTIFRFGFDALF
ncbi:MAG: hypothetical protein KBD78_13300 [Oligoflexales bacterium]|nr:hypothetical protein [Oligoflexales bacterium]